PHIRGGVCRRVVARRDPERLARVIGRCLRGRSAADVPPGTLDHHAARSPGSLPGQAAPLLRGVHFHSERTPMNDQTIPWWLQDLLRFAAQIAGGLTVLWLRV